MTEIDCHSCAGACCKGPETIELTAHEAVFMRRGGTRLITLAEPAPYARKEVPYPIGFDIDEAKGTFRPLVLPDHPFEPLAAGVGRYVLWGTCGYLKTALNGWEYCAAYEDRPQACQDFEMGSSGCQAMRQQAGIDEPEEKTIMKNDFLQGATVTTVDITRRPKPKKTRRTSS